MNFRADFTIWFFMLHFIISTNQRRLSLYFQYSWTALIKNIWFIFTIIVSTLVSALIINIFIFYIINWSSFTCIMISWTLIFLLQTNILNNSIYFLYCWLWFGITCIKWFWRLSITIHSISIKCLFFFFVKRSNDFFGTSRRSL